MLSLSWWAVVLQQRDAALQCYQLTTPNSGVEGALWSLYMTSYQCVSVIIYSRQPKLTTKLFCPKAEMQQQCRSWCLMPSPDYCIIFPNSNLVFKLAKQSVWRNSQCYLFNWHLFQKAESQFFPFQPEQNSHQLQWESHWNKKKFGGWIWCLSLSDCSGRQMVLHNWHEFCTRWQLVTSDLWLPRVTKGTEEQGGSQGGGNSCVIWLQGSAKEVALSRQKRDM